MNFFSCLISWLISEKIHSSCCVCSHKKLFWFWEIWLDSWSILFHWLRTKSSLRNDVVKRFWVEPMDLWFAFWICNKKYSFWKSIGSCWMIGLLCSVRHTPFSVRWFIYISSKLTFCCLRKFKISTFSSVKRRNSYLVIFNACPLLV